MAKIRAGNTSHDVDCGIVESLEGIKTAEHNETTENIPSRFELNAGQNKRLCTKTVTVLYDNEKGQGMCWLRTVDKVGECRRDKGTSEDLWLLVGHRQRGFHSYDIEINALQRSAFASDATRTRPMSLVILTPLRWSAWAGQRTSQIKNRKNSLPRN